MSASLQIMFLDSDHLGEPGSLEQVVQVFTHTRFEVDQFVISGKNGERQQYAQEYEKVLPLAYEAQELSFRAFRADWRLEVRQQVYWGVSKLGGERRAWIRTITDNTPYFWQLEHNPAKYSRFFLGIAKSLYRIVKPSFGWVDFDYGLQTTHDDIESLELPMLYWANFFGPSYVTSIGRAKIMSAPAWDLQQLPDGGILYVLASGPGIAEDHVPPDDVRSYFGVVRVR